MQYVEFMKDNLDKDDFHLLPLREFCQYTPSIDVEVLKIERLEGLCKLILRDTKTIIEE